MFGAITHHHILQPAVTEKTDFFNIRAVVCYVERLYMTCSFQVMGVSMHKMSYQKEVVMHVWIHNSPIISCIQL